MSVKTINLAAADGSSNSESIQYFPCNIRLDGDTNLPTYFNPYIHADKNEEGKEVMQATFRGYPFIGEKLKLPQGHVGFVMKESSVVTQKEGDEEASVSKSLKAVEKFSEFTFWNWDRTPCMADKYQQALTWVEVSKVIHGTE